MSKHIQPISHMKEQKHFW